MRLLAPIVAALVLSTMPLVLTTDGARANPRADQLAAEAAALIDQGDLGGAESKLKLAIEVDRANVRANTAMARLLLLRNELGPAQQHANVALGTMKTDAEALITLVRIQALQGQAENTVTRVQDVANTFRDDPGVQLAYAEALLAARRFDPAMQAATRVLKAQETSVPAMKVLARAYLGLERPVTAESILLRALEIERDPEALSLLAGIRFGEKNLIEARLLLEEALQVQPGYVEALNSAGAIYVIVRNWEVALKDLNKAIAIAPSFAEAWLNLGSAQRGAGMFAEAETSWKRALTLEPKMADIWFNLGILYLENPIASRDRIQQLTESINAFNAFKRFVNNDPNVDKYIEEARLLIKQEQERRNEQLKPKPEATEGGEAPPAEGDEEQP
jgi:tetratricopeptide (TPR) repeat protein